MVESFWGQISYLRIDLVNKQIKFDVKSLVQTQIWGGFTPQGQRGPGSCSDIQLNHY